MPSHRFCDSQKANFALAALSVILGSFALFAFNNLSTPNTDELYQTLSVKHYSDSPLAMLTFWIGNIWTRIFGFSILSLRNLLSTEQLITVGIATYWLWRHTRNIRLCAAAFLLTCVLFRTSTYFLYNWDAGAYIFDTAALILILSTIANPKPYKFLLCGAALTLVAMARIPTASFIPCAFVILWLACRHKGIPSRLLLDVAGGMTLCFLFVSTVMCGSPSAYCRAFAPENIISGHSPLSDTSYLLYRLRLIVSTTPAKWFPALGCALLPIVMAKCSRSASVIIIVTWTLASLLLIFSFDYAFTLASIWLGMDAPIGIAILLAIPTAWLFIGKIWTLRYCLRLELWACALFMSCVIVGSDAFIERLNSAFMLLPALAIVWPATKGTLRKYIKLMLILSLVCFSSLFAAYSCIFSLKAHEQPVHEKHKVFRGLRLHPEFLKEFGNAEEAIKLVREQKIPYLYIGDRKIAELTYGTDKGPNFHNFHKHPFVLENWLEMKPVLIDSIDAVVYVPETPYPELPAVVADIRASGFTDSIAAGNAIVLSRPSLLQLRDKGAH